jgi:hypothetical protein
MISHQFAEQMESLRDKQPSWIAFYEDSHPSGALRITTAIIEEFQRVAKQRGKRMLVLTFPSPSGFKHFRRTGVSPFQPLIAALDAKGCQARDLSEDFTSYLNGRSFCEINSGSTCMGHFNFEGNMVVAKVVHEYMIANGLIPKSR